MSNLDKHWETYSSGVTTTDVVGDCYYPGDSTTGGYYCSGCGQWVSTLDFHICPGYHYFPSVWTDCPSPNRTEQAFKILKKLVEEKVIKEPATFKKFCDLIEKIAKVI